MHDFGRSEAHPTGEVDDSIVLDQLKRSFPLLNSMELSCL